MKKGLMFSCNKYAVFDYLMDAGLRTKSKICLIGSEATMKFQQKIQKGNNNLNERKNQKLLMDIVYRNPVRFF
jgi:hypothetical protein